MNPPNFIKPSKKPLSKQSQIKSSPTNCFQVKLKTHRKIITPVALIALAFLARVFYLADDVIPFSFDHGKDSLAVMHLLVTKSPTLIGPWTSIPGLYFGPSWYYLLAPAFWLGNFSPVAGAVMMSALVLLQVWLAYKYFNKFVALIMATAPFWVMISTSAWNPFPMTLITLVILILLKSATSSDSGPKILKPKQAFLLGLTASFGFHFSAAFAIFYPVIILAILLTNQTKISLKAIFLAGFGYFLPFLPQLAFELRHSFVQTQAVIKYFSEGESHAFSWQKILLVVTATLGELKNGIIPEIRVLPAIYNKIIQTMWLATLGITWMLLLFQKRDRQIKLYSKFFLIFLIIPVLGFFFLHFNLWYVYAIIPALAVLVGEVMVKMRPEIRYLFAVLLVATPVFSYVFYFGGNKAELETNRGFLPIKLAVIDEIRNRTGNKPFSVYHYVPDIYDFAYQYLYLTQGFRGKKLPIEFSYKPGAPDYVVQKTEILEKLPAEVVSSGEPELIFYVVEKPENPDFLDSWWSEQHFDKIIDTKVMSSTVTLYEATPEKSE